MDVVGRQHEIKEEVRGLSAKTPEMGEGMWYRPLRDNSDYFRYSVDVEPKYDVYLDTNVERKKWGDLRVTAKVEIFCVENQYLLNELTEDIFRFTFNGHQPSERMFLMNIPTYQKQINEAVEYLAENAVARAD